MRISVLCAGSRVFGMEMMALAVMRGLRDRGHVVSVVASSWNDGKFAECLDEAQLPYELIYLGKVSKSLRSPALQWTIDALRHLPGARRQLKRHLSTFKPDVVLIYNRDWILLARDLLHKQRAIFHVHDLTRPSQFTRGMYGWLDHAVVGYVANSEFVSAQLVDLGLSRERTMVIRNGVANAGDGFARSTRSTCTIGIVGQIGEWKGHDDLITALSMLRNEGYDFKAAIFGIGQSLYVESLKQRLESLGLASSVKWLGYVRDPDEIYGQIDICVMPSRMDETFGLVAAEAGLRGVPVIASRRGGLREIIEDGVSGFLIDSHNPTQLADSIGLLLKDASLRALMGNKARERCVELFSMSRMVDEIEQVCRRTADGQRFTRELQRSTEQTHSVVDEGERGASKGSAGVR